MLDGAHSAAFSAGAKTESLAADLLNIRVVNRGFAKKFPQMLWSSFGVTGLNMR
jgi:hypothetical protein